MDRNRRGKIFDWVLNILATVAGVLILLIALFVSYSVTIRYMHMNPPIWILQCTEYALLWITFLAAAWLLRKDGHVRIDTLVIRLSPRIQRFLEILTSVLGFLVCSVIVWFGATKTYDLYARGVMDVKGVTLPEYPLFVIIPLGGLMLLIQFARNLVKSLKPPDMKTQ
ncbi:MAG: TRAP transporter small permease [Pseudomonadota bacterium]